jgi:hypothetical protein
MTLGGEEMATPLGQENKKINKTKKIERKPNIPIDAACRNCVETSKRSREKKKPSFRDLENTKIPKF